MPGASIADPVNQPLLNSDEIKHVRHLSRALLKNRAIEKKKIVGELMMQRKQLEIMNGALNTVVVDLRRSMLSAELVLNQKNSNVTIPVGNKVVSINGTNKMDKTTAFKADSTSKAVEQRRKIMKQAIDEVNKTSHEMAVSALSSSGEKLKETRPSEHRSKQMQFVIKGVVNELAVMSGRDVVDVKKIKALKERLRLKKKKISIDDISPTLSIRTKHRQ
ncbi:MAG: hypothetical protein L3J89_14955 [Gammaproteobacteria bacterium]|nr:hypothetical protein [Gammaproteobacteria bacterium]